MRRSTALTLAETVVAIFVLTLAIAFVGALLRNGLHHQAHSERRMMAMALARNKMAFLRAWARSPLNRSQYNFDASPAAWASQVPSSDPEYPNFVVRCVVQPLVLYSPCSSMEAPYVPLGTARAMNRSAKKVKISVADPGDSLWTADIVTIVSDPTRDLLDPPNDAVKLITTSAVPAVFSASGNDLNNPNPGSAVDMRAEALYPNSTPVPDLFFDWYIVPLGGTGTLITSRDGRSCRFVNGVSTGIANVTTEGNSVVAVHGSYRGQGQPPQNYVLGGVNPYINISPVYQLGP